MKRYTRFSTVVSINGDGSNAVAKDENGNTVAWNASAKATKQNELKAAENLRQLRFERDRLLVETDWWVLNDTPIPTQPQLNYRQALRDITNTYSSLDDVV